MGTHPIFESDFDCLTDQNSGMKIIIENTPVDAETTSDILALVGDDVYAVCQGRPLREGFTCEEFGLTEESQIELVPRMVGGKVHGSLARAGKVKGQTPKVDKQDKKKAKTGRAKRRMQYNRRFVNVVPSFGRRKDPTPTANAPKICDLARK